MKLSDEDKREIIRLNKEEGVSQTHLAEAFGVGVGHIADLIARYNLHGEAALIKGPNRKYSPKFKMEVINRYQNGEAKNTLAVEYDIKRSMIDSWLKRYEKDGYNGLIDKKRGRTPKMKKEEALNETVSEDNGEVKSESADKTRIKLLEKKNKELEAEVAYLKKLNALVRERKKRESKKK
jgi:transposase